MRRNSNNNNSPTTKKRYHRLETLPMLAAKQRTAMHTGNFVNRSKERYANRKTRAPDRVIMEQSVLNTAALVIQCCYRRYIASISFQHQLRLCILSQQHVVHHISTLKQPLEKSLTRFTTLLNASKQSFYKVGAFYYFAALLLKVHIQFYTSSNKLQYIRQSPLTLRTLRFTVHSVSSLLSKWRKRLGNYAAIVIQCVVRRNKDLRKYRLRKTWKASQNGATVIQSGVRRFFCTKFKAFLLSDFAAVKIQCRIRMTLAKKVCSSKHFGLAARKFVNYVRLQAITRVYNNRRDAASRIIQRVQRGRATRSLIRVARGLRECRDRALLPTRAFRYYHKGDMYTTYILLQQCVNAGYNATKVFNATMAHAAFSLWQVSGNRELLHIADYHSNSNNTMECPMLKYNACLVQYYLGDFKKCKDLLSEILFSPSHPFFTKGKLLLASVYTIQEEYSTAIDLLKEIEEDDVDVYLMLALLCKMVQGLDEDLYLYKAFQLVELEFGFYHGVLSDEEASELLKTDGAFLIHQKEVESNLFFIKTLSHGAIRSLKITKSTKGCYTSSKFDDARCLADFIKELPAIAEIRIANGVSKSDKVFTNFLEWKADGDTWLAAAEDFNSRGLCNFAHLLASYACQRFTSKSKRSRASFVIASAHRDLGNTTSSLIHIQKTSLSAVRKHWMSHMTSFRTLVEQNEILESKVTVAYKLNLFSANTKGDVFNAAVLLSQVESDGYPGDELFYSTLGSSHADAFCIEFESKHLELGGRAIEKLSSVDAAIVYYRCRKYMKAITILKSLQRKTPMVHWKLALCYVALDIYEEALVHLKHLLHAPLNGLSSFDLMFIAGYVSQDYEVFKAVHESQISMVKKILEDERLYVNSAAFREAHVTAIVVKIGESRNVVLPSVLGSKPSVEVSVSGTNNASVRNTDPPTWQSLSPEWNETLTLDVSNCIEKSLCIKLLNRYRRRESVVGEVHIPISQLIKDGELPQAFYKLKTKGGQHKTRLNAVENVMQRSRYHILHSRGPYDSEGNYNPRILNTEAAFQRAYAMVYHKDIRTNEPLVSHSSVTTIPELQCEISLRTSKLHRSRETQLLLEMPFDVKEWLNASFTWESVAKKVYKLQEFDLASKLFMEAVKRRKIQSDKALLVTSYARCLLATEKRQEAIEFLETVDSVSHDIKYPKKRLSKELRKESSILSSNWIRQDQQSFRNSVTNEVVSNPPLSFTEKPFKSSSKNILLENSIREKVLNHFTQMKKLAKCDKYQWKEVYNSIEFTYVSDIYHTTSDTKPSGYVLVRPLFDFVVVLQLQWSFRKRVEARKRHRRVCKRFKTGLHMLSFLEFVSRLARISREIRIEKERIEALACIVVTCATSKALTVSIDESSTSDKELTSENGTTAYFKLRHCTSALLKVYTDDNELSLTVPVTNFVDGQKHTVVEYLGIECQWIPYPGDEFFYTTPVQSEEEEEEIIITPEPLEITKEILQAREKAYNEMKNLVIVFRDPLIFQNQMAKLDSMLRNAIKEKKATEASVLDARISAVFKESYKPMEEKLLAQLLKCREPLTEFKICVTGCDGFVEYAETLEESLNYKHLLQQLPGEDHTVIIVNSYLTLVEFTTRVKELLKRWDNVMQAVLNSFFKSDGIENINIMIVDIQKELKELEDKVSNKTTETDSKKRKATAASLKRKKSSAATTKRRGKSIVRKKH